MAGAVEQGRTAGDDIRYLLSDLRGDMQGTRGVVEVVGDAACALGAPTEHRNAHATAWAKALQFPLAEAMAVAVAVAPEPPAPAGTGEDGGGGERDGETEATPPLGRLGGGQFASARARANAEAEAAP